jgi:hypothetical protein
MKSAYQVTLSTFLLFTIVIGSKVYAQTAIALKKINNNQYNSYYTSNRTPLQPQYFVKLPVTAIKPGGWLRRQLELQREGLTGNLGEISVANETRSANSSAMILLSES